MRSGDRRYVVSVALVGGLLVLLLAAGVAFAADPGLVRTVVGSGELVEAGGMRLQSVIGEPAAGSVHNGLNLCSGFLCGQTGDGMYQVFLPLVLRH